MTDDQTFGSLYHTPDELPDAEALDRVFSGESSNDEAERITHFFSARQTSGLAVKRYIDLSSGRTGMRAVDSEQSFSILQKRLVVQGHNPRNSVSRKMGNIYYLVGAAIAAVLVVVVSWNSSMNHNSQAGYQRYSTYTTANGQRATIGLPDGSSVALNVNSRLDVPVDFGSGNRNIKLSGEAVFNVIHRDESVFVVETENSQTRVLGTEFLVREYIDDTGATVAVKNGKVMVGSVVLGASEEALIGHSGASYTQEFSPGRFSFVNGILTLDNVPLPAAIKELNRWYDVDIRIGDPKLSLKNLGGKFAVGSIADCAEFLKLAFDLHVVREGRQLTLYLRS